MFTGLVSVAVIVAVLGSLVRIPKRRDLVWLSLGLVAGVFAQAVLGGLTVLFDLKPRFVMAHFLRVDRAAHERARARTARRPTRRARARRREPAHGRARPGAPRPRERSCCSPAPSSPARVRTAAAASTTTSRVSTSRIPDVARVHGTMVMIFLAAVLAMLWLLRRDRAPHNGARRASRCCSSCSSRRRRSGYVQYFNDIPAVLVGVHIAGATAVWSATLVLCTSAASNARPRRGAPPSPARRVAACTGLTRRRSWSGAVTVPLRPVVALRGDARRSSGRRSRTPTATASGGRGCATFTIDGGRRRRCRRAARPGAHGAGRRSRRRCRTSCTATCTSTTRCATSGSSTTVDGDLQGPGPARAAADRRRHRGPAGVGARAALAVAPAARDARRARRWRGRTTASSSAGSCSSRAHALDATRDRLAERRATDGRRARRQARLHALGDVADLLDVLHQALTRLLGRRLQVLQLLDRASA